MLRRSTFHPWRNGGEGIPLLFDYYARQAAYQFDRNYTELSTDEMAALIDFDWPGNVRQLKNIAERYVLGMGSMRGIRAISGRPEEAVRDMGASGGLPRRALNNKMAQYGIKRKDCRG